MTYQHQNLSFLVLWYLTNRITTQEEVKILLLTNEEVDFELVINEQNFSNH